VVHGTCKYHLNFIFTSYYSKTITMKSQNTCTLLQRNKGMYFYVEYFTVHGAHIFTILRSQIIHPCYNYNLTEQCIFSVAFIFLSFSSSPLKYSVHTSLPLKLNGKIVPVLNQVPFHEDVSCS